MDEREITARISKVFEETVPILNNIYRGFAGQKINLVKESKTAFRESLKKWLPEMREIHRRQRQK